MHPQFLANKDFWAGLLLIAVGTLAVAIAHDYPLGTARRMGPGYFPIVLGALLVLFGIYVLVKGLRGGGRIEAGWSLRALVDRRRLLMHRPNRSSAGLKPPTR